MLDKHCIVHWQPARQAAVPVLQSHEQVMWYATAHDAETMLQTGHCHCCSASATCANMLRRHWLPGLLVGRNAKPLQGLPCCWSLSDFWQPGYFPCC